MDKSLLLVGSVPLDTTEQVMRTFGSKLGSYLPAMPDGEVGERRSWVNRFSYQLFNGHPYLTTVRRPPSSDGTEQLLPRTRAESWQFKVNPGIEHIRFGLPGLRLGYAREATNSYFVFRTLREQGVLPRDLKFQISIPMVNSVIRPMYFPEPRDLARVRPGFEEALAAELDVIVSRIPAEDLAIQWDCAWEILAVYGQGRDVPGESDLETHIAPIRRLTKKIPAEATLGFHFCFGTFGGWPAFAPDDLGAAVDLINGIVADTPHDIDWLHIPMLNRTDESFYAPLARLDARAADVYLGMIHSMDSFSQRLAVARKFVPQFGLAAYCGFGRTPPEELPSVLNDHLRAIDLAGLA